MNIISRPGLLRNLQIGFGLSLLLLIVTSVASYSSISNLLEGSKWVDHTDSVIIKLDYVASVLRDAESGQRGYLLSGDTSFLRAYNTAADHIHATVDSIETMTADNPSQQRRIKDLRAVVFQPLEIQGHIIEQKKSDNIFSLEDLQESRVVMRAARAVLQDMQEEERRLMVERVEKVRRYSGYTPALIVIAAALSIVIILVFYRRVHADFLDRAALYSELQNKDAEISRRIGIIQELAARISDGQYATRLTDAQKDGLGSLSGSLNRMAESLEGSFRLLSDKEWHQTGVARLSEAMMGQMNMAALVSDVIRLVAEYSRSRIGALFIVDPVTESLTLHGSYALPAAISKAIIRRGEGPVGEAAASGKRVLLSNITETDWVISYASGNVRPRSMIAFPFHFERKVKGVIELGSLEEYSERDLDFFSAVGEIVGTAVNSIENRDRLQELLEETQAQSEELQSQHSEMESLNLELEVQAEKLQVSEEELKVQQEELMQTNQELEERSRTLEEKNQVILIRNLDIQKKADELALTTKYKSEFMANMSHELRTPLNSILLLSRLLSDNTGDNLSTEQVEYARVIRNSGQGLLELIDEILDLSRIESGKLPLEHTFVSVAEILDDMRMLFVPLAKDKNLELYFITDEDTPPQLDTDKMRLEQILKNLLSNAFKFTSKGSITLRVKPSPTLKNFVDFAVRDSGIGIPEDKHQLIFDAFQQADGSTRRKYGGTGLGLSISRELAKLLGGEIMLASAPDQGSEFTVSIPLFEMESADLKPGSSVTGASSPITGSGITAPAPGTGPILTLRQIPADIPDDRLEVKPGDRVLLIVEDDPLFAKTLLEFSRKKGYKGVVAVSGDVAMRLTKTYRPMGILLDIQLPVKNGWEVMDELKRDPQTRHIPVHIISSFEVKNESLLKGAVDFVSKPMAFQNIDSVFEKIEYVMKRSAKKVLIIEDNDRHAKALAFFLDTHNVHTEIAYSIGNVINTLQKEKVDGVILSREEGSGERPETEALSDIRQHPEMENIPIIVFTNNTISRSEEGRLRQYADSIIVKTAHSYQRVLDEVSLFLHLVDEGKKEANANAFGKLGALDEVLKNKTVIIADDDVRNIFSLTKALETHKMKVLSAMDGNEALALAEDKTNNIDIILMDMMMPDMDGFEAITRIRRNPRLKYLPIIAVTAKAMTGDREKCMQAGASDYISKPVDVDQLLSLLRIWLYEK